MNADLIQNTIASTDFDPASYEADIEFIKATAEHNFEVPIPSEKGSLGQRQVHPGQHQALLGQGFPELQSFILTHLSICYEVQC